METTYHVAGKDLDTLHTAVLWAWVEARRTGSPVRVWLRGPGERAWPLDAVSPEFTWAGALSLFGLSARPGAAVAP